VKSAAQSAWATLRQNCPTLAGFLTAIFGEQAPEMAQAVVFLLRRTGGELLKMSEPGDAALRELVEHHLATSRKANAYLIISDLMARYRHVCKQRGVKPAPAHVAGRWLKQMMLERHGLAPTRTAKFRGYAGVVLLRKRKAVKK
jgi:hypothetical protein